MGAVQSGQGMAKDARQQLRSDNEDTKDAAQDTSTHPGQRSGAERNA